MQYQHISLKYWYKDLNKFDKPSVLYTLTRIAYIPLSIYRNHTTMLFNALSPLAESSCVSANDTTYSRILFPTQMVPKFTQPHKLQNCWKQKLMHMQIPCSEEEELDLASINMQMKQVLALSICIPLVAVGSQMLLLQKKLPQHLDISSSLLAAAFPDLLLHHLWFSCISVVATWKHMSTSKSNFIPSRKIDQLA
jgi:hypothetical protein